MQSRIGLFSTAGCWKKGIQPTLVKKTTDIHNEKMVDKNRLHGDDGGFCCNSESATTCSGCIDTSGPEFTNTSIRGIANTRSYSSSYSHCNYT